MKLKVYKQLMIPETEEGGIANGDISYTCTDKLELIQSYGIITKSDTIECFYERISYDNGKTWTKPKLIFKSEHFKNYSLRYSGITYFLDEDKNLLLRFYNKGTYPNDNPILATWEVYYQAYNRCKNEWGEPISTSHEIYEKYPLIKKRGIIFLSCSFPIKSSKGHILVPCQLKALRNGRIWFPFPHYFSPFYESAVLIGKWHGNSIEWDLSEVITIEPNISCRLCEPTIVELKDGRLLMIMRGDNGAFPHKPGYKWYSISEDGGYTWTEPKPLKFDNGKPIYSPSSCSYVFRSRKTGKIYWIANILNKNPIGNRPRYPLQIVELDEENLTVKKETMLVIDDRRPQDSPLVQFSNFRCYEDRETGDLVLVMARYGEKGSSPNSLLRSPLYLYRIELD